MGKPCVPGSPCVSYIRWASRGSTPGICPSRPTPHAGYLPLPGAAAPRRGDGAAGGRGEGGQYAVPAPAKPFQQKCIAPEIELLLSRYPLNLPLNLLFLRLCLLLPSLNPHPRAMLFIAINEFYRTNPHLKNTDRGGSGRRINFSLKFPRVIFFFYRASLGAFFGQPTGKHLRNCLGLKTLFHSLFAPTFTADYVDSSARDATIILPHPRKNKNRWDGSLPCPSRF